MVVPMRRLRTSISHLLICICCLCFVFISFKQTWSMRHQNSLISSPNKIESLEIGHEKSPSVVLARVLYLFLCENQAEVDIYLKTFPTITADVLLYCWRETCSYSVANQQQILFVSPWTSNPDRIIRLNNGKQRQFARKTLTIIRTTPSFDFYPITTRVFIIN